MMRRHIIHQDFGGYKKIHAAEYKRSSGHEHHRNDRAVTLALQGRSV